MFMCTGQPPFGWKTNHASGGVRGLMERCGKKTAAGQGRLKGVDKDMAMLCARTMKKRPEQRPTLTSMMEKEQWLLRREELLSPPLFCPPPFSPSVASSSLASNLTREVEAANAEVLKMRDQAEVERKEAEITHEQALIALAAAQVSQEEAELEEESAAKELAEVEGVREKMEREGGNDVLLRSLLREQKEATEGWEKAAKKKEHAKQLQSGAQEILEAAAKKEITTTTTKEQLLGGLGGEGCLILNSMQAQLRRKASTKLGSVLRGAAVRSREAGHRKHITSRPMHRSCSAHSLTPLRERRTTRMTNMPLSLVRTDLDDDNNEAKRREEKGADLGLEEETNVTVQVRLGEESGISHRSTLHGTIDAKINLPSLSKLRRGSEGCGGEVKERRNDRNDRNDARPPSTETSSWLVVGKILMGTLPLANVETLMELKNVGVGRFFALSSQSIRPSYEKLLRKVWGSERDSSFSRFGSPPSSPLHRSSSLRWSGSNEAIAPTTPTISTTPTAATATATAATAAMFRSPPSSPSSHRRTTAAPRCSKHIVAPGVCVPDQVLLELKDLVLESVLLCEIPYIHSDGEENEGHVVVLSALLLGVLYGLEGEEALERVTEYNDERRRRSSSSSSSSSKGGMLTEEQVEQVHRLLRSA